MSRTDYTMLLVLNCFGFFLIGQTTFVDVTENAGIDHQFMVYEGTFGGGATVFDLNNDGHQDIYITSGTVADVLYLNNGDGTFTNIFEQSGLEIANEYVTQGVVSADVNRDGFRDLFITTINTTDGSQIIPRAKNLLFINNGDATFHDATKAFKLDDLNSFSTGPSFGDVNADGYPDLFIGNYFQEFQGKLGVLKDATIVSANQTAKSYLLINHGGEYFENEYEAYGLGHKGFGFGAVFTDYDNDGDQDLLVNQDFGYKAVPNFLYENLYPKAKFKDVSKETGMDLKINAMGAAVGDYDNNGFMDYFVTNIKFNWFMQNHGSEKSFSDRSKELNTYNFAISWGANFADFDHDGDLDLFVANGDLNPNCTPMPGFYYENVNASFTEKARDMGIDDYGVSRGSVTFDYDNDGDLDLLIVNQKPIFKYPVPSFTRLYRNDSTTGNWLKVKLNGVDSDKNGIGARVTLKSNEKVMIREIDGGGSSHLSQNSTVAHFGLGTIEKVDEIEVTWVGGKKQLVKDIPANQLIMITEIETPHESKSWWWFVLIGLAILAGVYFLKKKETRTTH